MIEDLTKEGRAATRVHLKVRFAPFFTHTKVRKLAGPTMDPAVIAETALALFDALDGRRGRCGCSACGRRWSRPRAATERLAGTDSGGSRRSRPDPSARA